jgi:hypothetical protein
VRVFRIFEFWIRIKRQENHWRDKEADASV